jgi:hypothetical protein
MVITAASAAPHGESMHAIGAHQKKTPGHFPGAVKIKQKIPI